MTKTVADQQCQTHEQIIEHARGLRAVLEENVATGEQLRRLPDAASDALQRSGMFRLLTPKSFGGHAADVATVLEVATILAESDASASWLVTIGAVGSWLAAQGSPQLQQEIFAAKPDARLAGSLAPVPAQRVERGLRVSGAWTFASGAHHADWAVLCASVLSETGAGEDILLCFVPAQEATLQRTWCTVGMRGTGSDSWVTDDLFVPYYRTTRVSEVVMGTRPVLHDDPTFRAPLVPAAAVFGLGTLIGTGIAALNYVVAQARTKPLHNTCFARQADSPGVQIQVGEAATKIATARLHAHDIAVAIDQAAADSRPVPYATRAEWKARTGFAAQTVVDALTELMNIHGAGSFAESNRLQQYWRDANTVARHSSLQMAVGYEVWGEALLEVDKRITTFV